jgi:3'-5' exoribonuclease
VIIPCLVDINEAGQRFEGFALVKSTQDRLTANGAPFFTITLGKKERQIACKLWDRNFGGYSVEALKTEVFREGSVLFVSGTVSEYNNELQLTIEEFRILQADEADIQDYLASSPEPIEDLQQEYETFLNEINSPMLKEICLSLYLEHKEKFIYFPAGKSLHHAVVGGLLWHVVSMLRIGKQISAQYPEINRDLLIEGIALHDLGKVVELSDYIAPDYTKIGNFLGHITIVNMFIDRKAQKMKEAGTWPNKDFSQVYELMHVISAHHGKLEWGSPVQPALLEAEVIHQIDMLDSRINMVVTGLTANSSLKSDETIKVWPLGHFYRTTDGV